MVFDWYLRHRYSFLLLTLLFLLVAHPLGQTLGLGRWLYNLLATLVFFAAFFPLFQRRNQGWVALVLGVPTLVAIWAGYFFSGLALPLALSFHITAACFLGFTAVTILLAIYETRAVTGDRIMGAFSGYLLLGLVFGHVYSILEWTAPGSFRVPAEPAVQRIETEQRLSMLTYFSFATLTTVGYGDIIPATSAARHLAIVEAVSGQFYLAVVMAVLIGLRVSLTGSGSPPGEK